MGCFIRIDLHSPTVDSRKVSANRKRNLQRWSLCQPESECREESFRVIDAIVNCSTALSAGRADVERAERISRSMCLFTGDPMNRFSFFFACRCGHSSSAEITSNFCCQFILMNSIISMYRSPLTSTFVRLESLENARIIVIVRC